MKSKKGFAPLHPESPAFKNGGKSYCVTGFTLIEILVAVTIIVVLVTMGVASYRSVSQKARDTRRKSDLAQIRAALEMYRADYGVYPQAGGCAYNSNCYVYSTGGSSWIPAIASYMDGRIPVDPKNTGGAPWTAGGKGYTYTYGNVGNGLAGLKKITYDLTANLENANDEDSCVVKHWKWYEMVDNVHYWCSDGFTYPNTIYEDSPGR